MFYIVPELDQKKSQSHLAPHKRLELLKQGQDLFNDENFFEAHEAWEALWHGEVAEERVFIQGLIQAAAHFHHVLNRRWGAAESLARLALQKIASPIAEGSPFSRLDVEPLESALVYNLEKIPYADGETKTESFLLPKLFEL